MSLPSCNPNLEQCRLVVGTVEERLAELMVHNRPAAACGVGVAAVPIAAGGGREAQPIIHLVGFAAVVVDGRPRQAAPIEGPVVKPAVADQGLYHGPCRALCHDLLVCSLGQTTVAVAEMPAEQGCRTGLKHQSVLQRSKPGCLCHSPCETLQGEDEIWQSQTKARAPFAESSQPLCQSQCW